MGRLRLIVFFSALAVLLPLTHAAASDNFPSRPIRMVIGYPPGGPNDIMARALAQELNLDLGQTVYVDNHGGASGTIAAGTVAHAAPDGYTLVMETSSGAANATLYRKLPYDMQKDFTHIGFIAAFPLVLVVNPNVPAHTVGELLALAKAKPGSLAYASGGTGGAAHLATELFKSMTGADMLHVPYNGTGPALLGVVSGQTQLMFAAISAVTPYVQAGRLRVLGVTSATRTPTAPDLPTIAESGVPGYEVLGWLGLGAPAGVSPDVTNKINAAIARAVQSPRMAKYMAQEDWQPSIMTPEQYTAFSSNEIRKWGKVVRDSGAHVD